MANNTKWVIDATHTSVEFSVRHMMVSRVNGRFGTVEGFIQGDPHDLTGATIAATIDASSIDTNQDDRDAHLRSADFFETDKFPKITFKSTSIQRTGDDRYTVTGDLTIRGTTKSVDLETEVTGVVEKDMGGQRRMGLEAGTEISRKDFGLTWNVALEAGGFVVSDEVRIKLHVEAVAAEQ